MLLGGAILPEEQNDRIVLAFAFLGLFLTGYLLFLYHPDAEVAKDAVPIGVLRTDKSVRHRHAKSLHWGNTAVEGTVYLRDIIYTPKDTWAEFTWNDKKLILEPESMVQFDEVALDRMDILLIEGRVKSVGVAAKQVRVKKAEVFQIIPVPKSARSEIGDIAAFELKQSEVSQRTAEVLQKKLDLDPLLNVQSPNMTLNRLSDYNVKLLSPASKDYNAASARWVPMVWAKIPVEGVKYTLEVAKDSGFGQAISQDTDRVELAIQFDGVGEYYWRVKAHKNHETIESETAKFALVESGGVKMAPPRNTASAGAKTGGPKPPPLLKPPPIPKRPGDLLLGP